MDVTPTCAEAARKGYWRPRCLCKTLFAACGFSVGNLFTTRHIGVNKPGNNFQR
jgi:hypothetical protein